MMWRFLSYLFVVCLICACGLDEPLMGDSQGTSIIEFSASKMRVITKAGDSAEPFSENTSYRLFAVNSPSASWSGGSVKFFDVEGLETGDHKVEYSINAEGDKASFDVGQALDFYGVTYGSSTSVAVSGTAGMDHPSVTVAAVGNVLPDLMYSDNLKSKTSSSGLLMMEFRHALSKLTFEVVKQDEKDDTDKKLEEVVLKKVTIKGSGLSGIFNVATGGWTIQSSDVEDRVFYDAGTESFKIENFVTTVPGEMLVIPNDRQLSVEIVMDGLPDGSDEIVEYPLMIQNGVDAEGNPVTEPLRLEPNHEYRFTITVLKNDVRIVTVTPQKYDWIDVDLNGSIAAGENFVYLGQPVYFGGLMWMDRNLGATSADCENDWYHSIGYYYQFGRNIPYMVDVDAYLNDSKKSWAFTPDRDATDPDAVFTMKFIYTIDNAGKRVTTAKHANNSSGNCLYDNVAINPGDPGDYSYIRGYIYENSKGAYTLNNKSWAKQYLDFINSNDAITNGSFDNHVFWQTIGNQPCPKGWRLPGKSDMFSFMPESTKLFWLDTYNLGDYLDRGYDTNNDGKVNTDDTNHANFVSGNKNAAGQEYQWKYFAGKFVIDSSSDKSADYSYPVKDEQGNGRVYGIKYEGEDKAYRVMVEQRLSTYSSRKYVRISRFEAKADDRFELSPDCKQWNIHKFDWETPVEYMDIPLAGFMYESGMSDFGGGTILRAVEGDGNGTNWTLYLRSGHNGIAVGGNSRRNLGENIRCVRDVNAE